MENYKVSGQFERSERLQGYIAGLLQDRSRTVLYREYEDLFQELLPADVFAAFSTLMSRGTPVSRLLEVLGKVVKILAGHMPAYNRESASPGDFIFELMKENERASEILEKYKGMIAVNKEKDTSTVLRSLAEEIKEYEIHLLKKENILFPSMEKKNGIYSGVALMWALHDEFRECIREIMRISDHTVTEAEAISRLTGRLYFLVFGLIEKENILMFPAAASIFAPEELHEMYLQSLEYDPSGQGSGGEKPVSAGPDGLSFRSSTGELTFEQLILVLNSLPVDISYVDENDILRYFNSPAERIFHRSPASIGRNVRNCHPPKSYDAVEKIIEDLRSGTKDSASFWIDIKEKKILIEYYAIRDSRGNYRGVLEASRDITELQKLEGEKRL